MRSVGIPLIFSGFLSYTSRPARPKNTFFKIQSATSDDCLELGQKFDLNLLLIDHYDSFTYNLADILAQMCVKPPIVLASDCVNSWNELLVQNQPGSTGEPRWDGIILSPGPGNPRDAMCQISRDCVLQNSQLPILGVCLGHQILGDVYGATIECAPQPVHGQISEIRLLENSIDDPLWNFISGNRNIVNVTRYHSLHVTNLDPTILLPTAECDDINNTTIVMAMRHASRPHYGVQFHPESIGTNETGKQLLHNFLTICDSTKFSATNRMARSEPRRNHSTKMITRQQASEPKYYVYIHKVPNSVSFGDSRMKPLDVMEELLKDQDFSFWLDEARTSCQGPSVSILGSGQRRIEYWGREKTKSGIYVWDSDGKLFETLDDDILSYFQKQYECLTNEAFLVELELENELSLQRCSEDSLGETFPFQFRGGHVGYLGYEVRHDTARFLEEEESGNLHSHDKRFPPAFSLGSKSDPSVPTAAFLWADKSFVYDHRSGDWYLVGVASKVRKNERMEILNWLRLMSMRLQQGKRDTVSSTMDFNTRKVPINLAKRPAFNPRRSRKTYELNFDQCIDHIRQGESYELCLTNQLKSQISVPYSTPFGLYKILRRRNPAPFAAFFSWNAVGQQHSRTDAALAICCSSPERFVSVKRSRRHGSSFKFEVEAKPIKGTIARVQPSQHGRSILTDEEKAEDTSRANKLRNSVKDRAENLMIVDLLRNDLSRVCEPGSVHVTNLMDIESFATVHQMVSTIRGTLNPSENNAIDVLKACFPGGSMTGAPKIRTMELLDALEEGFCRGPYSGCLGYISLNGSMDMNIIIRTAVLTPSSGENEWNVSIGAGGAITALSESTDEYQELLLKASAVIESVVEWASASSSPLPESESGENKAVRIIGSCQRNSTLVGSV